MCHSTLKRQELCEINSGDPIKGMTIAVKNQSWLLDSLKPKATVVRLSWNDLFGQFSLQG
jgi:hypothetical protein